MTIDYEARRATDNRQPLHRRRMPIPTRDVGETIHRTVRFWIESKPHLATLNVLRSGEVNVIRLDVNEPVDVLLTGVEKLHKLLVFGLVKCLGEVGLMALRYEEVNIRFDVQPQRLSMLHPQLERYTIFFDLAPASQDEGVSPIEHLAQVTIYIKRPRFAHVRGVLRRWKRRRKIKKLIAQHKRAASAGGPRSPLVKRDGHRNIDEGER